MKKSELKEVLKPLIKECIKEAIFEDGVLSGLITEVAQGLGNVQPIAAPPMRSTQSQQASKNETVLEAKKQLNEVKSQLQKATGLQGIFEGTTPIRHRSKGESSQYGALRDKDPSDSGVNIDGLIKMTGGWDHLK
jgi:hypothetical protein